MKTRLLPELHDARLIGISYLADASIRLDFVTTESANMCVLLTGVVHFFCSGMLEGNIVESVEVIDAGDISSEDLTHFVEKEGRGQKIDALKEIIDDRQLSMILLSPSYGAEVGGVCAGVAYDPVSHPRSS
ncbi:MAG: hypothetical protein ACREV7_22170 [Steroidobacteraceae bacterium]